MELKKREFSEFSSGQEIKSIEKVKYQYNLGFLNITLNIRVKSRAEFVDCLANIKK